VAVNQEEDAVVRASATARSWMCLPFRRTRRKTESVGWRCEDEFGWEADQEDPAMENKETRVVQNCRVKARLQLLELVT